MLRERRDQLAHFGACGQASEQHVDLRSLGLSGTMRFENGTTQAFTTGTGLNIAGASSLDANGDGVIGFDQNDAFSQMLMGGYGQQQSQPFYTYNPNPSKFKGGSPCFDGINQTLAPGMLDTNMDKYPTPMSGVDSALAPSTNFGFDNFDPLKGFSHNNVSGMTTPGENDWSSLLDSNAWEEQASQPAGAN